MFCLFVFLSSIHLLSVKNNNEEWMMKKIGQFKSLFTAFVDKDDDNDAASDICYLDFFFFFGFVFLNGCPENIFFTLLIFYFCGPLSSYWFDLVFLFVWKNDQKKNIGYLNIISIIIRGLYIHDMKKRFERFEDSNVSKIRMSQHLTFFFVCWSNICWFDLIFFCWFSLLLELNWNKMI